MMMIKMAAVSTITLLLLCCLIASTDSQADCDQYAATGSNVIVSLNHNLDKAEKLKWKHNNKVIVYRQGDTFHTGTKDDITENGSLKLTNLMKGKAGEYIPEVFDKNGKLIPNLKSTKLCILDPVQKPKVEVKCSPLTLTCQVNQAETKFKWFQNNKELEKENGQVLKQKAEALEKYSFRCEVYNLVSNKTSDSVDKPCFTYKPILPDRVLGISIWVFIGGGGAIILLLMIIVIVCCITTRRRKRLQLKDEGELRLAWTNEQQQHQHPADQQHQQHHNHHHHHPHHHQQQPAGHTGPRQHRSKQQRDQQRPRAPDHGHPLPSPRRAAQQAPKPVDNVDDEQPPPLPQPRKKAPKTPRV